VLGYLPQRHPVFSGTVRENVSLFDPARPSPDPRTAAALVVAGLADDLVRLPAGDATPIGELGVRFSGGQRQRIALARAIAAPGRPPGLLVLDDPFSAVDVATELRIIAAVREQRATVLLCSTRLSAFPLADRVVVLDAGRVVEQGRHEDLLADNALYARIYRAQRRVARPDGVRP
jgi:ABC-type multidrug transport system fused ATPase/permease subunit